MCATPLRRMAGSATGASETSARGDFQNSGTNVFSKDTINFLSLLVEIENRCLNAVSVVAIAYASFFDPVNDSEGKLTGGLEVIAAA